MKLGIYQCRAAGRSQAERLDRLEQELEGRALDLLVCPELFASGYNVGADLERLAEAPDGPFGQAVAALARRQGCAIAFGYPERAGDVIYNAAALYDAQGRLLANHRKRLPSPGSFEVEAFGTGEAVTFAELGVWRVAMVICYEVEFPESGRQAAQGGAQLLLVPTALGADWGMVAERVVGARAYENGIYLAYADHAGEENGARYFGGSRIVGPDGRDIAAMGDEEGVILADIALDEVARMQKRLPFLQDCAKL